MILGMDWLQLFSPMKVDWLHRWLVIPYKGTTVRLQGTPLLEDFGNDELLVHICSITPQPPATEGQLPLAIGALLTEFPSVICPPDQLPPKRDCDHEIPLIEGARSVTVRPYRYPPALKDEIESQVDSMLQQGIIQRILRHSTRLSCWSVKRMVPGDFVSTIDTSMPLLSRLHFLFQSLTNSWMS